MEKETYTVRMGNPWCWGEYKCKSFEQAEKFLKYKSDGIFVTLTVKGKRKI